MFGALWVVAIVAGSVPEMPDYQPAHTHLGDVKVREFGEPNAPLVVVIHGMNSAQEVREEWTQVAMALAYVFSNFDSNFWLIFG